MKRSSVSSCELCSGEARMYCKSDQASLCWDCDDKVHGANFLVAKHTRAVLCHLCQSPTPWKAAGRSLGRTVSVCEGCVGETRPYERVATTTAVVDDDFDVDDEDEDEGDSSSDYEEEDEDDEDDENQVVPRTSTPRPPATASTSSSGDEEESYGRGEGGGGRVSLPFFVAQMMMMMMTAHWYRARGLQVRFIRKVIEKQCHLCDSWVYRSIDESPSN